MDTNIQQFGEKIKKDTGVIGLHYDKVKLLSYNPKWKKIYEKERRLLSSLNIEANISIEHIGSTAVPNLSAKAIIDIMIGVEKIENASKFVTALMDLDYLYLGECGRKNRFFYVKGKGEITTHHLHLVKKGSKYWRKNLLFKDVLFHNKNIAKEYAKLKMELAQKFSEDREAYKQGKTDFIEGVLEPIK